jgi:erythromycin esterase-like protein
MSILSMLLACIWLAALPTTKVAEAAQDLDCATHVKTAQGAIDKVTDDMKGMDKMPKDQLKNVNTLLNDAKNLVEAAQKTCRKPKNDYESAQAIAKAEAARGSAEAADILHWHYMKATPGMKDMNSSSGKSGMDMPGMKK